MSHLSSLELDELIAGTQGATATEHLASCDVCRSRYERLKSESAKLREAPQFMKTLESLEHARPMPQPIPLRRQWWVPVALAAVAALIVAPVLLRDGDGTRLKGSPTVEVLRDGRAITTARAGDLVTLAVGAQGKTHALLFSVESNGTVSQLWPKSGPAGLVATGASVALDAAFRVTPGSFTVIAFFTDVAQPAEPVRAALESWRGATPAAYGKTAQVTVEVSDP